MFLHIQFEFESSLHASIQYTWYIRKGWKDDMSPESDVTTLLVGARLLPEGSPGRGRVSNWCRCKCSPSSSWGFPVSCCQNSLCQTSFCQTSLCQTSLCLTTCLDSVAFVLSLGRNPETVLRPRLALSHLGEPGVIRSLPLTSTAWEDSGLIRCLSYPGARRRPSCRAPLGHDQTPGAICQFATVQLSRV